MIVRPATIGPPTSREEHCSLTHKKSPPVSPPPPGRGSSTPFPFVREEVSLERTGPRSRGVSCTVKTGNFPNFRRTSVFVRPQGGTVYATDLTKVEEKKKKGGRRYSDTSRCPVSAVVGRTLSVVQSTEGEPTARVLYLGPRPGTTPRRGTCESSPSKEDFWKENRLRRVGPSDTTEPPPSSPSRRTRRRTRPLDDPTPPVHRRRGLFFRDHPGSGTVAKSPPEIGGVGRGTPGVPQRPRPERPSSTVATTTTTMTSPTGALRTATAGRR